VSNAGISIKIDSRAALDSKKGHTHSKSQKNIQIFKKCHLSFIDPILENVLKKSNFFLYKYICILENADVANFHGTKKDN